MTSILQDFARPENRASAAATLARHLGVDAVLMLTRDAELDVLLPAPGFPQTLAAGPAWRAFVRALRDAGVHQGLMDARDGSNAVPCLAIVDELGSAMVLVGGAPVFPALGPIVDGLPLLLALLGAEARGRLAAHETLKSRARAERNRDLALALESARIDVESALTEAGRLNAQLAETDRLKDEFLALLGHELRNPLSGILGAAHVLKTKGSETVAAERAHAVLERQSRHLARLVDDLLDVSRIKQGKIKLDLETVDVAEIVERAVEGLRPLAERKHHRVVVRLDRSLFVSADRTRLEQMVANLVTNAVRYTDPGGDIRVSVWRDGSDAVVGVEDDGIGIPEDMRERIFQPFVQGHTAQERSAGGLGVGLMLVQRLAELHGGTVSVVSEEGKGSHFTLRLSAQASAPTTAASTRGPQSFEKRRVLVVDDNVDSAEMVVDALRAWGHEVARVADGRAAIELANQWQPDTVLLDIGLPDLSGYEVARLLRQRDGTRGARIIAVSGYALERDRALSRQAGIDLHLAKPIGYDELQMAILSSDGLDVERITA